RSGSPRNRSRPCTRSQTHSTCGAKARGGRSSAPVPCSRLSNGARSPSRSSLRRLRRGRMTPTADLPDDPRLPGLMAIRDSELAAQWLRRTASLQVKLGLPFGAAGMMHETRAWIGTLGTADLSVGAAARALAEALARTEPRDDGVVGLVHGTLYARHILDAGDGPGVIDWHRFGQGPVELDAGM